MDNDSQRNQKQKQQTLRYVFGIAIFIFLAETLVMFMIRLLDLPDIAPLVVDPFLLLILLLPTLYYFIYRPLTDNLLLHEENEELLRHEQDILESRIQERTVELAKKNESLIREITERKKIEQELREKSEFLNVVIDSLGHPFYVIDAKTYEIKLANKAANFGDFPPGVKCHKMTHGKDAPCDSKDHPCSLAKVLEVKKPVVVEHVHLDNNGQSKHVEVHAHPIFDNNGEVIDIVEFVMEKNRLT